MYQAKRLAQLWNDVGALHLDLRGGDFAICSLECFIVIINKVILL